MREDSDESDQEAQAFKLNELKKPGLETNYDSWSTVDYHTSPELRPELASI